MKKETHT